MPAIFETATIKADIETVFDLISRIEDFPLYVRALKEVRKVDHKTYRWSAQARGFSLTWDSVITEYKRPTRLAWRSIRGLDNSGAYTLVSSAAGTTISLRIQYSFPSRVLETLISPLVNPITRALAAEALARVKARLENGRAEHLPAETSTIGGRAGAALTTRRHFSRHA
ncbi:MAG: SRPBCC family protein [Methylovirgula sp.]